MPQPDTPPREPRDSPTYPKVWKQRRDSGSKMVLDHQKATNAFLASIRTSRTRVAWGFSGALEGELGAGERLPDTALTLDLVGGSVANLRDAGGRCLPGRRRPESPRQRRERTDARG